MTKYIGRIIIAHPRVDGTGKLILSNFVSVSGLIIIYRAVVAS